MAAGAKEGKKEGRKEVIVIWPPYVVELRNESSGTNDSALDSILQVCSDSPTPKGEISIGECTSGCTLNPCLAFGLELEGKPQHSFLVILVWAFNNFDNSPCPVP